jgi:hypothetical protein
MKIFSKSVDDLINDVFYSIEAEVETITPNDSVYDFPSSLEQIIETMTEKYKIKSDFSFDFSKSQNVLVSINVPSKSFSDHEQLLYNNKTHLVCHAVKYSIPFKGNSELLNYCVKKKKGTDFEEQLKNNIIDFLIPTKSYEPKLSDKVKNEVREEAVKFQDIINQELNGIKEVVVEFNSLINPGIKNLFELRRIELAKEKNEKESLNPFR